MSLDNKCLFDGRLAADPKFWDHEDPKKRHVRFSLAVQKKGAPKDAKPHYLPIVQWGNSAAAVAQYCKKGKRVKVEAEARQNIYTKEDGTKVYEIEFVAAPFGIEFKEDAKKNQVPTQDVPNDLAAMKAQMEAVQAQLNELGLGPQAPATDDDCPIP